MAKLKLVAPWDEYYNEMNAFFAEDPDVTILYDEEEKNIKVLVNDQHKAEALTDLLVSEKDFGSVKLAIEVVPANDISDEVKRRFKLIRNEENYYAEYESALVRNRAFAYTYTVDNIMGFNAVFVVFKKKVIQYYNDNLGDLNGMKSTLAEEIARDIFAVHNGIFFCTDTRDENKCRRPDQAEPVVYRSTYSY